MKKFLKFYGTDVFFFFINEKLKLLIKLCINFNAHRLKYRFYIDVRVANI